MKTKSAKNLFPFLESRKFLVLVFTLIILIGGWLSAHRIFQVDEIQTMHMAWLLIQQDAGRFFNSAEVYMIPLALICRFILNPITYMISCRFVFLAMLVASCIILARAVSRQNRLQYHIAFLLLVGMPILWDFGFEVRHDNVVILGLCFLILILFRRRTGQTYRLMFLGGLTGGLLFLSSFKSVFLWFPILVYTALLFAIRDRAPIFRIIGTAAGGITTALALGLIGHLLMGSLTLYVKASRAFFGTVGPDLERFFDWEYFLRFISVHPWMVSLGLLFFVLYIWKVVRNLITLEAFHSDDPQAKRMMLLILGPLFLALNPTPFPYNYTYIAVLFFPAVFYLTFQALTGTTVRKAIVIPSLLFLHFLPGLIQTSRHLKFDNREQRKIVTFVNQYTEPIHCVFDGAGLAMFRKGPGEMWYLHSLNRAGYMAKAFPSVRAMLARNLCPLLIQSYKWNFMDMDDMDFIRSRYISFHGVIWILGCRIICDKPGSFPFEIHRDGWYTIGTRERETIPSLKVDGAEFSLHPVFLRRGAHEVEISDSSEGIFILWTKGDQIPSPPVPEVFQPVFVNWY